jgi:hypothetical protein
MGCCGPTGPSLCGGSSADFECQPPTPVATVVAGPVGPTGATGPQGYDGQNGASGPAGPTGATGPLGPQGFAGQPGPTGASGASGAISIIGYFSGARWQPGAPYSVQLNTVPFLRNLNFGVVQFTTGNYLCKLDIQVVWNTLSGTLNGDLVFWNGPVQVIDIPWASEGSGSQGGVVGYSHSFIAQLTQGATLYLRATGQAMLVGAQLTVCAVPSYNVVSPGFNF